MPWSMAGDAVRIEPVSGCYSLLTGNLTGIFARKWPFAETAGRNAAQIQARCMQIPYAKEQGISCSEQGFENSYQRSPRRVGKR